MRSISCFPVSKKALYSMVALLSDQHAMCNFVVEVGEEEEEDDVENPSAVGLLPSISRDKTDESPADERRYFMVFCNALCKSK